MPRYHVTVEVTYTDEVDVVIVAPAPTDIQEIPPETLKELVRASSSACTMYPEDANDMDLVCIQPTSSRSTETPGAYVISGRMVSARTYEEQVELSKKNKGPRVLPGQLAIPGTGVADVPKEAP